MGKCTSSNRKQLRNIEQREEPPSPLAESTPIAIIQEIQLSEEGLMLSKIAERSHTLALAYQDREQFAESLNYLEIASELYLSLDMKLEYNEAKSDLLLAALATHTDYDIPTFIEPFDKRTSFIAYHYLHASEGVDLLSIQKQMKEMSRFSQEQLHLVSCLLDMGHIYRIWLKLSGNAIDFYKEALANDSENPKIYFYLGLAFKSAGNYNDAARYYKKGIELDSTECDCYFNLGNLYFSQYKKYQEAINNYKNALNCYKDSAFASLGKIHFMLGQAYYIQNRLKSALKHLIKGIAIDPFIIEAYKATAECSEKLKYQQTSQAFLYIYEVALSISPSVSPPFDIEKQSYKEVLLQAIEKIQLNVNSLPSKPACLKRYFQVRPYALESILT